ncbi:MAG: hypothetical protein ACK2T3_04545 [Candidatus Promineifilaceae bacterium]
MLGVDSDSHYPCYSEKVEDLIGRERKIKTNGNRLLPRRIAGILFLTLTFTLCACIRNEPITLSESPAAAEALPFASDRSPEKRTEFDHLTSDAGSDVEPVLAESRTPTLVPTHKHEASPVEHNTPPTPESSSAVAPPPPLINYFTSSVNEADSGDSISLSWSTYGAITTTLYHLLPTGQLGQWWDVPQTGSFEYDIPVIEKNVASFALFASGSDGHSEMATVSIRLRCLDNWFFDSPPDICPADQPLFSAGAVQNFQNGMMIWVEDEDQIYVLYEDSMSPDWNRYSDSWQEGVPESDPSLVPPEGLQQPIRGFGLLWREEPGIRQRLGWALGAEMGFDTVVQRTSYAKYNETFIQAPDGGLWRLFAEHSGWEKLPPY